MFFQGAKFACFSLQPIMPRYMSLDGLECEQVS